MKKKSVIVKIMKLDENKQYGYSMTKPLPTGCIKENKNFSWVDFNILIETVPIKVRKIDQTSTKDYILNSKFL